MRDGPPPDENIMASENTLSIEILLHEIAMLRSKLRDLEDDNRSSICESIVDGDAALMLKKEVVKLADEKAKQEKEFMNQMSSLAVENRNIIADLKSRLARSRGTQEELEDRVEAMQRAHESEIERLTENLTRADEETTEARQEIDYLQQENKEFRAEKHEMAEENEVLRLELENERRRTDSYRNQLKKSEEKLDKLQSEVSSKDKTIEGLKEQIGEMNDSMVQLEERKEQVESRLEIATEDLAQAKKQLQSKRNDSIDHSIFSAEKESLERSCEQLEERLLRTQARLAEKDATIESLTNSLKEERSTCRKMRQELREERDNGQEIAENANMGLSRSLHGTRESNKELEYLLRRNKCLTDEVRDLRKQVKGGENGTNHAGGESHTDTLKSDTTLHPLASPPRSKKFNDSSMSPRTAVSGLVATFEKRIHGRGDEKREDTINSRPSDWPPSVEKSHETHDARSTIEYLEKELQEERETVARLRKQLQLQPAITDSEGLASLERELKRSRSQVDILEKKIEVLEKEKHQYRADIEQLQHDAKMAREIAALQEEKKEEEMEEEVVRLRSQVGALQPELNHAMEQVETLNGKISELQRELAKEQILKGKSERDVEDMRTQLDSVAAQSAAHGSIKKKHNAEVNKLQRDLTSIQLAKDDMEMELSNRIKELETEFEAMEIVANEEINELKSQLANLQQAVTRKDGQITLLEKEKNQLCSSMFVASNAKNGEFEELQSELIDTTAKNTAQAREIQTLKMRIEELESVKRDKAEWLQDRVGELEQEVNELRAVNKKSGSWEDIERLRRDNMQLKESVREMKLERRNLQDRIESLVGERASSKSVQILRDRNASLKEEVEKLTRRLKKMEESITRFAI